MRKKIVAGNWKMNLTVSQAKDLVHSIASVSNSFEDVYVACFTPAIHYHAVKQLSERVSIGLQNFYPEHAGAYTGELGIDHLKDIHCTHVLIGHSERRLLFHEDDQFIKRKVDAAISNGITPVFCCGEPLEIRDSKSQLAYVKQQLESSLFHLSEADIKKCIIAYEPIWAIGTGKTASVAEAEEMHAAIRSWIEERYDHQTSNKISILYGGSCNASNAKELFACPNVDGGLIGGASLKAESFLDIIHSF
jgi:triosephosphate isomerase